MVDPGQVRRRSGRRRWALVIVATLGLAGAVTAAPADAAFSTGVTLVAAHSGKCLTLKGSSAADNTPIVQYACQGLTAQRWRAVPQLTGNYQLVSDTSNKCANVEAASLADSARVIEFPCQGTANERWKVQPVAGTTKVQLVNEKSGKCLDIAFGSSADNAQAIQYTCGTATSQRWTYPPATSTSASVAVEQNSRVNVIQTSTSSLEYAYTDNIGRLLHGTQSSPSNTGTLTWETLSGLEAYTGQPVLSEQSDGRIQLNAQDTDSDTWYRTRASASQPAWNPWSDVGGGSVSHAITAKQPNGSLVQFAVDPAGALWHQPQDGTIPFLGWRSLGNPGLTGTPTAVTVSGGIRLFGLNGSGVIQTALYSTSGGLSAWTSMGGSGYTGSIAAIVYPGSVVRVVARGTGGAISTKSVSSAGVPDATWVTVGTLTGTGSPAGVISPTTGKTELVARGSDGAIYNTGELTAGSGTWRAWQKVSFDADAVATDPTALTYTHDSTNTWAFVFRTSDNQVRLYEVSGGSGLVAETAPTFIRRVLPAPPK